MSRRYPRCQPGRPAPGQETMLQYLRRIGGEDDRQRLIRERDDRDDARQRMEAGR